MSAVQCSTCGAVLRSRSAAIEVRTEYRAALDQGRLRTWRERLVCKACAAREWDAHDGDVRPTPLRRGAEALIVDDLDRRLTPDETEAYLARLFPGIAPLDDAASLAAAAARRSGARTATPGMGPCAACRATFRTSTGVERRVEYRSLGALQRLRTWRTAWVCRACADAEAEAHDFPHGRAGVQEALL